MTQEQIESIYSKLEAGHTLHGQEALYFLALHFSNATHGNYSPEQLLGRIGSYSITLKKEDYFD